jgi:hypothetical protein
MLRTIDRPAEEAGIQEVSRRNKLSWRKATPQSSIKLMKKYIYVNIIFGLPWNEGTLSLLKTIHMEKINATL